MTVITSTIGSGKDYATVAAWEAATDNDLVTATETHIGVLHDQVTEIVTFDGATTDSTYYRQLKANERYDPAWDVGAKISGTGSYVVTVDEDYFVLGPGIGVVNTTTVGAGRGCVTVTAANVTVESVVSKNTTSTGGTGFHTDAVVATYKNCIAIGAKAASGLSAGFDGGATGTSMYHCVAYGIGGITGITTLPGKGFIVARFLLKNCIAMDCLTQDFDLAGDTVHDYNISSDATADGTNSLVSKNSADIFAQPDSGDFRLRGPDGVDDGVAIGSVTTDYLGNAHNSGSTGTEIGAFDGVGLGQVVLVPGVESLENVPEAGLAISALIRCSVSSVASGEAFGTPQLNLIIHPDSVAPAEAFGTLAISTGAITVSPDSVTSAEAFGTLTVSTGAFTVSPDSVAPAEAFGTVKLNLTISPDSVAPAEAFGTLAIDEGIITIYPDGIASAEVFGSLVVTYDQIVSPTGIASAEAFGTPSTGAIYCHESLHNSIRNHFDSNTSIGTVIYDNVTGEAPDSGLWVRFSVETSFSEQTHCGHQIHMRKYGDATASIFAPINDGDGDALDLVDDIRTLFRDVVVGSVVFLQPNVERIGRRDRWWRIDVVCPFYYDDVKPYPDAYTPSVGSAGTVESAHNVIRAQFKALVADVLDLNVQYDNTEFDAPDNEPWLRLSILDGDSVRTSSNSYLSTGIVDVAVFVPIGEGDQEALSVADRIVNTFLPSTVSGVQFRVPSVTSVGRSGRFWQVTVSCPFNLNEIS